MGNVIETAAEIDRLMNGTGDDVGLLFDTGHPSFAGEDPAVLSARRAHRIGHVHAKDIRSALVEQARRERWSFLDSVVAGAFTVPGDGTVDFAAALQPLRTADYAGWMIVEAEQDPAKANPLDLACRGYAHLRPTTRQLGFELDEEA